MARAQLNVAQFVKESVKRPLDDGNLVVFFNNKLVSVYLNLNQTDLLRCRTLTGSSWQKAQVTTCQRWSLVGAKKEAMTRIHLKTP
jgi:hypothetical protein